MERPCSFSQSFSCPDCGISIDEIEPRSFSFNNPFGACPECFGLGYKMEFDEELMIPDKSIKPCRGRNSGDGLAVLLPIRRVLPMQSLRHFRRNMAFSLDTPYKELPAEVRNMLIHGTNGRSVKVYYKGQRGEGVYDSCL